MSYTCMPACSYLYAHTHTLAHVHARTHTHTHVIIVHPLIDSAISFASFPAKSTT